jgi:FkbM family methyltransferase
MIAVRLNSLLRRVVRLLPASLRLSVQSRVDVWQHSAEPENVHVPRLLPQNRRAVALDIGANNGVTTWLLSREFQVVHGFEPNPQLAAELAAAAPRNVRVHQMAVSNKAGEAELLIPVSKGVTLSGWGSLRGNLFDQFDQIQRVRVPTQTIDSFQFETVDFIKIDVEGHEMSVLEGGQKTIERCLPWLVVEALGDQQHEVRAFLKPLGYEEQTLHSLTGRPGSPHNLIFIPQPRSLL